MVRIIPGDSWKLNPSYRTALEQLSDRAARRFTPTAILDVVGIEIDGVNVSQGLSEASIFMVLEELTGAVLQLCRDPEASGQVSLDEGRTVLVLGRHGARASLSVVSLARPARLLAGELEVDLAALALAASEGVRGLLSDLEAINPAVAASPFLRRLARRAAALEKAARLCAGHGSGRAGSPPLARRAEVDGAARPVALVFDLQDERGRVDGYRRGADLYSLLIPGQLFLRDAAGAEVPVASGPPFLLLTDLERAAREIVGAVQGEEPRVRCALGPGGALELELPAGRVRLPGGRLTCPPLTLARAFFQGALDFGAAVSARNPAQSDNAYLSSLCDSAREGLAQLREIEGGDLYDDRASALPASATRKAAEAPLGKGTLKRLRFRVAWSGTDTGERARRLGLRREALLVLGEHGASWIDPKTGSLLARQGGDCVVPADGGVLITDRSRLTGYSPRGRALFVREQPERDQLALTGSAGPLAAGPGRQPATLCAFEGRIAAAIYAATGRAAWQLRVPQAVRISVATLGERAFVASDTGALYALEALAGRTVFRVRTAVAFEGELAVGADTVASLGRAEGGLCLSAFDALSGRPRFSQPLGMRRASTPLFLRRKLLVGGSSEGVSTVACFAPDGKELFRTSLEARAGVPALALHRGRIYCGLRDGSVTCLDATGARLWTVGASGLELDRALAPVVRRDVLVAAGDPMRALDPETGRVLADLPSTQGLSAFEVGRGLDVYAVDDDGVVARFALVTHLSVVR